ncbi:cytochrome P450 [Haliea sp. E1-2-M8]|nr:cytochrome P450 [Haliea sp. E1-2-M8]MDO8861943.1 cytochrome P450 [Haliea sp. E1-2-M8]
MRRVGVGAGDKVLLSFLSANHDERVFSEPAVFDIRRDPNPHLSFGHGPHFCIGAQLAVAQMRALFTDQNIIASGRVLKSGRQLIFGGVTLRGAGDQRVVASGTSTYMLLPD